jgi:cytochrome c553
MRPNSKLMALCLFAFTTAGCGTNVDQFFLQSGTAVGQTLLDLLLTELVNTLADAATGGDSTGNGGTDGGTNGGADGGNGGGNGGDVTGDATAGATVFASNGCGSCHCADASGGCALSAPSLIGISADLVNANFGGGDPHPTSPSLSAQQLADLAAWFGSL